MGSEERKEIFFLKTNDLFFKPDLNPISKSIVTDLIDLKGNKTVFTDIKLDKQADGNYFIIAAPST